MSQVDPLFLEFQSAVVGRYSLERELGRGGMGVVYLAHEVRLDRLVAIKVLPPHLAANPGLRERFLREARTAAKLSHPNIVPIFSVDEAAEFVFYAMAFVDGETLGERLRAKGPLPSAEASRVLREVAWALGHAHAQGVVHRDVKPANILVERSSGRALVTDFGIARHVALDGGTTEGERLGTPEYMSPEQAAGDSLDGRSDIYSLGIVGFVALTGQLPFNADSAQAMLAQHITKAAPSVASVTPSIRRGLAEAVDRCLLKDPGARFADASQLADALGESIEKRVEIPIPVRLFINRWRNLAPWLVCGAFAFPSLAWLANMARMDASWYIAMILMQGIVALPIPIVDLLLRLRRLREAGYGPEDLSIALREAFRAKREEFEFEYGVRAGRLEIGLRALAVISGILSITIYAIVGGRPPEDVSSGVIAGNAGLSIASALGAWAQRRERLATESLWARFWETRFARWLARVASIGVVPKAVHADRPTEIAIALSAQALYAELPKEMRKQLGDFPVVMQALETRAAALRSRLSELDSAALESDRLVRLATPEQRRLMTEELEQVRSSAQDRLRGVVTALGTLRLDLLRLKVGSITLDGFTADLSAARELGDEAQRLLDAKREVERAVRSISPRPV